MPSTMTTVLMAAAMGALAVVSPAAAAAAAAAAAPSAPFVRVPFNDCSATGKSHVSGVEVSASSWPPRAGSETVLRVAGQLDGEVASGTYKLSARYLGQQTITAKGDLGTFVDLPAAAGAINIAGTLALPADSPAGPYFVQLEFDADNGETLTCVDVKFILDKVRPTVQIADDTAAAAADPSVLQPIVDASAEQERAELMAEKHRVELANRMADRMNGDIEVPVITIDASLPTDKEPGTITVSAPAKPQ